MKNIVFIYDKPECSQECFHCYATGYYCYTPHGNDFETCPCCGKYDFVSETNHKDGYLKFNFLYKDEYEEDIRRTFNYCSSCKIIFQLGCTHSNQGCSENALNCHFISKWRNKVTNDEYEGMPEFENEDDWFNNVNNVEVLEKYCPHNGNKCKNTSYKITEECSLKKDIILDKESESMPNILDPKPCSIM